MATPHDIPYDGLEEGEGTSGRVLFSIDTHPTENLLTAGEIQGTICLYRYVGGEDCQLVSQYSHHRGSSCRALQFSSRGSRIYSGTSRDGSLYITDTDTCSLLSHMKKAHSAAVYTLHSITERLLASGDESGELKLWDTRQEKCVMSLREHKDFISDMVCNQDLTTLLTTSGDGTLCAIDLRQKRLEQRSDPSENELLSLAIIKGGRKVVCGDSEGNLLLFHWGLWGDITDRFPSHPQSIDSLLATSDSVVCSGCMDGAIRAVQILPNQVLTEVGRHTDSYPIDCMRLTHDKEFMVTCSQDHCKFWPVSDIPKFAPNTIGAVHNIEEKRGEMAAEEEEVDEEEEKEEKRKKRRRGKKRKREIVETDNYSKTVTSNDFFSDLLS